MLSRLSAAVWTRRRASALAGSRMHQQAVRAPTLIIGLGRALPLMAHLVPLRIVSSHQVSIPWAMLEPRPIAHASASSASAPPSSAWAIRRPDNGRTGLRQADSRSSSGCYRPHRSLELQQRLCAAAAALCGKAESRCSSGCFLPWRIKRSKSVSCPLFFRS